MGKQTGKQIGEALPSSIAHPRDALEAILSDEQWGREKTHLIDRFRRLCDQAINTYHRVMDEDDSKVALQAANEVLAIAGIQATEPTRGSNRALDFGIPASVAVALMKAGAGLAQMNDIDPSGFNTLASNMQAQRDVTPSTKRTPTNGKSKSGISQEVLADLKKTAIENR